MYVCMGVEHLCWNLIRHLWTNILTICGLSSASIPLRKYICILLSIISALSQYNTSVRRYLVHKHVFNQTDSYILFYLLIFYFVLNQTDISTYILFYPFVLESYKTFMDLKLFLRFPIQYEC